MQFNGLKYFIENGRDSTVGEMASLIDFSLIENFFNEPLESITKLSLSIIKNETRTLCNNLFSFMKIIEINFTKLCNFNTVDKWLINFDAFFQSEK